MSFLWMHFPSLTTVKRIPLQRQLQIMVSDEEEEEEGDEQPARAPALAAATKAASPAIELPETPPRRSSVVDLTGDDGGAPSFRLTSALTFFLARSSEGEVPVSRSLHGLPMT